MHDLVIRSGTIVDGTGGPARTGDVAVDGGVLTQVGGRAGAARRELDADGLLVTPGFVDVHTHYDGQVTWDPLLTPSCWHGVTTAVIGNCGVGFAPVSPDRHDWLIGLMEGVEDIPGSALAEGITWGWESFPEYLDALGARRFGMDVAAQVPHGALRAYVMGDRGARDEPASTDDVAAMARLVGEAVRAGALGFTTSRTRLHRTVDGDPVPGTTAGIAELTGIGDALRSAGAGVFGSSADLDDPGPEMAWMERVARESGRPVWFACVQKHTNPDGWRTQLAMAAAARRHGAGVVPQVAGRPAGVLMGWGASVHPFFRHRAARDLRGLPAAERLARLRDPAVRAAILAERVEVRGFAAAYTGEWHRMFPLGDPPDYEPPPERSVAATAAREGRPPAEVAYDVMLGDGGEGLLYFPLVNYAAGDFEALREMLESPGTVLGLGDGGAHVNLVCDASTTTFMLTHWARDRSRGPRLGVERVVEMLGRLPAELYGLADRGVLAPGRRADVNVVDHARLRLGAPRMVADLPAGGRRLLQRAEGYAATVVAGEPVHEWGEDTGARPGRLVRGRPRPAA